MESPENFYRKKVALPIKKNETRGRRDVRHATLAQQDQPLALVEQDLYQALLQLVALVLQRRHGQASLLPS